MKLIKDIKKMCTPAIIYLLLSLFSLLVLVFSNLGNRTTLCVGEYDCPVDNVFVIFVIKVIYIAFVTIVLDSLCKNGWGTLSWFLVFLPIFFSFVVLGLFMLYQNNSMNQTIVLVQEDHMV
jgi:hypothetical protein